MLAKFLPLPYVPKHKIWFSGHTSTRIHHLLLYVSTTYVHHFRFTTWGCIDVGTAIEKYQWVILRQRKFMNCMSIVILCIGAKIEGLKYYYFKNGCVDGYRFVSNLISFFCKSFLFRFSSPLTLWNNIWFKIQWLHHIERVVDLLPLMTYGLKLSLEAWILEFKNFDLSFKENIWALSNP